MGDLGSIPGLGRSSGGGHGKLLQYSCLENPHGQRSLVGYSPWGLQRARHDWTAKHTYIYLFGVCILEKHVWLKSQRENAPLRFPFSATEEDLLSFLLWGINKHLSTVSPSGFWPLNTTSLSQRVVNMMVQRARHLPRAQYSSGGPFQHQLPFPEGSTMAVAAEPCFSPLSSTDVDPNVTSRSVVYNSLQPHGL